MELQSSKRMVKCLCRNIQGEQLCFPPSDIERFDILNERGGKGELNTGNRFNPSALGIRGMIHSDKGIPVKVSHVTT